MQTKTLFGLLSIAITASAAPNLAPRNGSPPPPTCGSGQVVSCCDSIDNGLGLGCIFSTLNVPILNCSPGQATACCNGNQVGLVNVECVPIAV